MSRQTHQNNHLVFSRHSPKICVQIRPAVLSSEAYTEADRQTEGRTDTHFDFIFRKVLRKCLPNSDWEGHLFAFISSKNNLFFKRADFGILILIVTTIMFNVRAKGLTLNLYLRNPKIFCDKNLDILLDSAPVLMKIVVYRKYLVFFLASFVCNMQ